MGIVKTLSRHGNSHALILDRALMEHLGVSADTPLRVTMVDGGLFIERVDVGIGEDEVDALMGEVRKHYGRALKRLAE